MRNRSEPPGGGCSQQTRGSVHGEGPQPGGTPAHTKHWVLCPHWVATVYVWGFPRELWPPGALGVWAQEGELRLYAPQAKRVCPGTPSQLPKISVCHVHSPHPSPPHQYWVRWGEPSLQELPSTSFSGSFGVSLPGERLILKLEERETHPEYCQPGDAAGERLKPAALGGWTARRLQTSSLNIRNRKWEVEGGGPTPLGQSLERRHSNKWKDPRDCLS